MSKLHLALIPGSLLPRCGRMLARPSPTINDQSRLTIAESDPWHRAWVDGNGCSHCAREVGLLPKLGRFTSRNGETEDEEDSL